MQLFIVNYSDLNLFAVQLLFVCYIWLFFFNVGNNKTRNEGLKGRVSNKLKLRANECFSCVYIYTIKLSMLYFLIFHGRNSVVLFGHFNVNNFSLNNSIFFFLINYFVFFFIKSITGNCLTKSNDYYFAINNILLCTPLLFYVNTLFTFLFILEVISVLMLYKLVSSKIWFFRLNSPKNNKAPQQYINMLFFQFWVTFFSTTFVVYFYINVFYIFGSSEWFLIQFLDVSDYKNLYRTNDKLNNFLVIVFLFGIFFKLGVSPTHLFKLEVYKGIPYLSIFFYTIYFLTIYLYFTVFLLTDLLVNFKSFTTTLLFLMLVVGVAYVIVLVFDISFLKIFFAYSTIINTLGFLMTTVALF